MSEVSYTVRVMQKEDIPAALEVVKETGMMGGNYCFYTWLEVDPEGFNVAVTDSGEIIAVCAGVLNHDDLGVLGFYACSVKHRGKGIGMAVWQACMEHIGPDRNAALSAVPAIMELYRTRAGFSIVEDRFICICNETNVRRVDHTVLSDAPPAGVNILSYDEALHLPLVLEYDLALMGYSRASALRLSFKERDSHTLVSLIEGRLVGFGTIKLNLYNSGQIGPLYADDPEVAEVMLRRLIEALPQATGFVMITVDANEAANELMSRVGCPVSGKCTRLYRKKKMDVDLSKMFGLLDLGFTPF